MPKKQKKTLNKKTKLKNTVNVKINIDNSKKTSARRTPLKVAPMQPFANFPSYQPTRIQQLEPKQQFSSPDLSKTMDEYQKQFKTYLETKDKDVKEMIEKFDDTLKKNIAPKNNPVSQPGASTVYANQEGETIFEQPIKNEIKKNKMTEAVVNPIQSNQLFAEASPATVEALLEGSSTTDIEKAMKIAGSVKKGKKIIENYEKYVTAYKNNYDDNNYDPIDKPNKNKEPMDAAAWGKKATELNKKLEATISI
jgi:hypothetical protein